MYSTKRKIPIIMGVVSIFLMTLIPFINCNAETTRHDNITSPTPSPIVIINHPTAGDIYSGSIRDLIELNIESGTPDYSLWINYSINGGLSYNKCDLIATNQPIIIDTTGDYFVYWNLPAYFQTYYNCKIQMDCLDHNMKNDTTESATFTLDSHGNFDTTLLRVDSWYSDFEIIDNTIIENDYQQSDLGIYISINVQTDCLQFWNNTDVYIDYGHYEGDGFAQLDYRAKMTSRGWGMVGDSLLDGDFFYYISNEDANEIWDNTDMEYTDGYHLIVFRFYIIANDGHNEYGLLASSNYYLYYNSPPIIRPFISLSDPLVLVASGSFVFVIIIVIIWHPKVPPYPRPPRPPRKGGHGR